MVGALEPGVARGCGRPQSDAPFGTVPSVNSLLETSLPLPNRRQGKVRDVYDLPPAAQGRAGAPSGPRLLIVATDRISAFDVVMPTPIPGKGRILTDISTRWFSLIAQRKLTPTHLITTDVREVPGLSDAERESLRGRVTIARRCRVVPVECVVRGYLDGSGWNEYSANGRVCGVALPAGLKRGDRLPQPIFTPATKEAVGKHDENIDFDKACAIAGAAVMTRLRDVSIALYREAHGYAVAKGLILADTKFEFGYPVDASGADTGEAPILIDEALTPDSSRYWDATKWKPGGEQASFDKQFLREYLLRLVERGAWNKQAPGPALPADVVEGTRARYESVLRQLFGGE